jgi:Tfp pilus assembly protein PilN
MPALHLGALLLALFVFGAVVVAITGSLLLWSYRRAPLAAAAEREEVALSARAYDLSDELAALLAEVDRLASGRRQRAPVPW